MIIGHSVAFMLFCLSAHKFRFRVLDSVYFPPGKAGNVLRGALASALDFARAPKSLPSGLAEPPRPFVLRAAHLDAKRLGRGEVFSFDLHLFGCPGPLEQRFEHAVAHLAETGLGPRRGRVEFLRPASCTPVMLELSPDAGAPKRVAIRFCTPTELKGGPSRDGAPFGVLFRRIRDRVSTLRSLYGEGPLPIDFKALSQRADLIRTVKCDLQYRGIERRSSRTGAVHGIGGFTGTAEYEGDLAEFLPYLRAAWWTGVGRYTVWGNGVIEIVGS